MSSFLRERLRMLGDLLCVHIAGEGGGGGGGSQPSVWELPMVPMVPSTWKESHSITSRAGE
jgi:hypothetical protein